MRNLIFSLILIFPSLSFSQAVLPDFEHTKKVVSSKKTIVTRTLIVSNDKKDTTVKEKTNVVTFKDTLKNRVVFYGLTALNNANDDLTNSITATGRLGLIFSPSQTGVFKINIGANLLNAKPSKGVKRDSVDFNSLMFPETGNFGFHFNPSWRLKKFPDGDSSNHSLLIEGSFTYRRVNVDSPSVDFKVLCYNLGLKYQWDYLLGGGEYLVFTGIVYWNFFNIPDEDVTKFNTVINDPLFMKANSNAEIHSIGCKVTAQYKSFIFFADLRRNTNTTNLSDDNPFKGTKFNIGFATVVPLKRF